jgi:transcription antitermination protein NusB
VRVRTAGRELAFKFLYSLEAAGRPDVSGFAEFARDQEPSEDARAFALGIVEGVTRRREALIATVEAAATNWAWRRMPLVDRTILIAGAYELAHMGDIPPQVTINEYVDIAKEFGSATSGAFVNGVLDGIRKRLKLANPQGIESKE